jgi:hypothetical protein
VTQGWGCGARVQPQQGAAAQASSNTGGVRWAGEYDSSVWWVGVGTGTGCRLAQAQGHTGIGPADWSGSRTWMSLVGSGTGTGCRLAVGGGSAGGWRLVGSGAGTSCRLAFRGSTGGAWGRAFPRHAHVGGTCGDGAIGAAASGPARRLPGSEPITMT